MGYDYFMYEIMEIDFKNKIKKEHCVESRKCNFDEDIKYYNIYDDDCTYFEDNNKAEPHIIAYDNEKYIGEFFMKQKINQCLKYFQIDIQLVATIRFYHFYSFNPSEIYPYPENTMWTCYD